MKCPFPTLASAQGTARVVSVCQRPLASLPLRVTEVNVLTSLCFPPLPVYAGFHAGTVYLCRPPPHLSSLRGPALISRRGAITDGRSERHRYLESLQDTWAVPSSQPAAELGGHRAFPPVVLDREDVRHPLTHVPYDLVSGRALDLEACLVIEERA